MVVWTIAISQVNEGRVDRELLDEFRRGCEITAETNQLNSLATAEYRWGSYEVAIEDAKNAIEAEKNKSGGLASLAMSMFGSGDSKPHPSNYALLAMCYHRLKDSKNAKAQLDLFNAAFESSSDSIRNECDFFTQELNSMTIQ